MNYPPLFRIVHYDPNELPTPVARTARLINSVFIITLIVSPNFYYYSNCNFSNLPNCNFTNCIHHHPNLVCYQVCVLGLIDSFVLAVCPNPAQSSLLQLFSNSYCCLILVPSWYQCCSVHHQCLDILKRTTFYFLISLEELDGFEWHTVS